MAALRTLAFAAALGLAAPAALADSVRVYVDQTITVKLNAPATSIVLGNPFIADVAVHDANTLLVTGKTFGSTNLMALGASGETIFSTQLAVGDNRPDQLRIITPTAASTFSCVDRCRQTPAPGGAQR
jgi:Flp pilus assembly secretin CpaC